MTDLDTQNDRFGHFVGLTTSHLPGDLPHAKCSTPWTGPTGACPLLTLVRQRGEETDGHSFVVDECAIGFRFCVGLRVL
jgi:hypothetical protein